MDLLTCNSIYFLRFNLHFCFINVAFCVIFLVYVVIFPITNIKILKCFSVHPGKIMTLQVT